MADAAFGLRPIFQGGEQPPLEEIYVDSSNATAIFQYDPIKRESDGYATPSGAGGQILGVALGLLDSNRHPLKYLPVSTAGYVQYVPADDVRVRFLVQEDSDASNITDAGLNFDLAATAGVTTSGRSRYEIDSSSGTTGSAQVRVVATDPTVGAATSGSNRNWVVQIIETQGAI